jgi:hypothetical protein
VTLAPLPVAPRPYPDETLRSWANRVGAWYGMSGTELVNALRSRAVLPEADGFSSLEDCEHEGITPRWVTDLLADAARLPRQHVYALRQDDYARWIPPYVLWNGFGADRSRRCWRCLATCGEDHERRVWRAGWTSVCVEHGLVLDTHDQSPSPYAVQLEGALGDAIHRGSGWVGSPWPVAHRPLVLPVSLMLLTLATLAEYLCDEAEAVVYGPLGEPDSGLGHRERAIVSMRLVDIAAHAARALADPPVSQTARGSCFWRCRKGLTATQHHGLMAGLGWLLSAWPDHVWRLLFHPELLSPPVTPWPSYPAWGDLNFAALRERARAIAWPLWNRCQIMFARQCTVASTGEL